MQPWVQRIAQTVAEQVKSQHGDHNRTGFFWGRTVAVSPDFFYQN